MDRRIVLIFTKPPVPGRVKTRLIGELSPSEAARLHEAFLEDLLTRLPGGSYELRIAWALREGEEAPTSRVPGWRQRGRNLGERLYNGLVEASREAELVAAVGSDHPGLTRKEVDAAFDVLAADGADVVLGPALDGGYYLIALRGDALEPDLFREISWSSSTVLEQTRARCEGAGLGVHLLPRSADVDTPADLERLEAELKSGSVRSPQTAALLRSWGRLSAEEGS